MYPWKQERKRIKKTTKVRKKIRISIYTFSLFFIEAGRGMEEPPPRLLRVAEPLDGAGDVGASSSTVI